MRAPADAPRPATLVDGYGRAVRSLRLSVTDRCNLRCLYCMPAGAIPFYDKSRLLTFEEMTRIVAILAGCGVGEIRLTGGEPLLRRDLPALVRMLAAQDGVEEIALTTNGLLLAEQGAALVAAGVQRFNVHLDALEARSFRDISRRDGLERVLGAVDTLEALGVAPIKINVVLVRGVNDDQIPSFVDLAVRRAVQIRFIELMPLGGGEPFEADRLVPGSETRRRVEAIRRLEPLGRDRPSSPATVFRLQGGAGDIGFINPVTEPFCAACDRIRLTADGKIRTCLFARAETDVAALLRGGAGDAAIAAAVAAAVSGKEAGGCLDLHRYYTDRLPRKMWQIGG